MLADQRFWIMSDHYDRACGRVAWAAGDRDTSVERLGRAAAEFLDAGALPYASYVLADLAEAASAAVRPKVAADAAGPAEDVARQLGRPQFAALAALAGAAAALAVGRYDEGAEASHEAARLFIGSGYQALGARSLASVGALPRDEGPGSSGRAAARGGRSVRHVRLQVASRPGARDAPSPRQAGPAGSRGVDRARVAHRAREGDRGARRAGHECQSDR